MKTLSEELESAIERGFSDRAIESMKKKLREATESLIYDDLDYDLKDSLAANLSSFVHRMADEAVEQLLRGNAEEMRARLKCSENSWTGRDRKHFVIHGKLFEDDPFTLRREIAQAHADLIANERILDLEDQVASLVEQVAKLEREKKELWERVNR